MDDAEISAEFKDVLSYRVKRPRRFRRYIYIVVSRDPETVPGIRLRQRCSKMAEEEETDVLLQRVVKDINNAFKRNPNMYVYSAILT